MKNSYKIGEKKRRKKGIICDDVGGVHTPSPGVLGLT